VFPNPARVFLFSLIYALFGLPRLSIAQCSYPCWTEIPSQRFTYQSFESQPVPSVVPPYEFSLPYPAQTQGAWSEDCNARENPDVDLYYYDPASKTWQGPLAGPVYRNPTYLEVSREGHGRKGIAVQVSFAGRAGPPNGNTLVESVFFHSDRCYRASTEFGFSHYIQGRPSDDQIYFYYELNANCSPTGKCRAHGTEENLVDQRVNLPIAIPSGPNSHAGSDWFYEAYLINGGSQWHVRVIDPYSYMKVAEPVDQDVAGFFRDIAENYWGAGADGYVTATATRNGPLSYSAVPVMNVVKIDVAK
jgi:hypothetical protein